MVATLLTAWGCNEDAKLRTAAECRCDLQYRVVADRRPAYPNEYARGELIATVTLQVAMENYGHG